MTEGKLAIITPTQTFTPQDDNMILLYIEFGMAQKYVTDLSRNVKRGNHAKLERGIWPNYPPPGDLNDRLTKTIAVDPLRFPLLRRAWDLLLTGRCSIAQIVHTLNGEWGYRGRRDFPMARALSRARTSQWSPRRSSGELRRSSAGADGRELNATSSPSPD